ncbi:MAG: cysteine--tRNA ligase [Actinomycetota bacterium]|nr:cysteine--tRNA ligase [Actinomycetota bacterium]
MPITLFDSKLHEAVEFTPLRSGEVSMYVCGPTVQSSPHVGHLRSALVYDLWSRWFTHRGYAVRLIRNVTDIDDKILEKSSESGEEWWALAAEVESEFQAVADALNIARPALQPRATGDIPAMVELIETLIERDHAYVAEDGSGDVYFSVSSWESYGELTNQSVENLAQSETESSAKRNPEDFALWKGHKAHEPTTAAWPAPWGRGRPGWHLECSAMSTRYLGEAFDIHGGGMDLRFPHHENELAQSRAAGHDYAHHWMHNALVLVGGQKMSKSLGNSIFAADMVIQARPIVVRYALASAHYRSELDLHEGYLTEAAAAFDRIEGFLVRARSEGIDTGGGSLPAEFEAAMDDDLSIPSALAVVHEHVRHGNQALDSGDSDAAARDASAVRAMVAVLGLDPLAEEWTTSGSADVSAALDSLVESVIALRWSAKADKNFDLSDALRDAIERAGIDVKDSSTGSTWSLRG